MSGQPPRLAIIGPDGALRLVSEDITGEDVTDCTVRDDVPDGYPADIEWNVALQDWATIPPPPAPVFPTVALLSALTPAEWSLIVDGWAAAGVLTAPRAAVLKLI